MSARAAAPRQSAQLLPPLMPPGAVSRECRTDPHDAILHPEELAALGGDVVLARRSEYATVRSCAREAMSALGVRAGAIVPDRHGAPMWPDGLCGSLTHCRGFRGAAVAPIRDAGRLGIDAEPNEPLPRGVIARMATPEEAALLAHLPDRDGVRWDRLLFSAKEAAFKAMRTLPPTLAMFRTIEIGLSGDATFEARARLGDGVSVLGGRWACADGLLLSTCFG